MLHDCGFEQKSVISVSWTQNSVKFGLEHDRLRLKVLIGSGSTAQGFAPNSGPSTSSTR